MHVVRVRVEAEDVFDLCREPGHDPHFALTRHALFVSYAPLRSTLDQLRIRSATLYTHFNCLYYISVECYCCGRW